MSEVDVITLLRDAFIIISKLSGPILLLGMLVGLVISILQTTTSIQEQTLTFVPKLIVTGIGLIVLLSWMLSTLITYTKDLFSIISKL